MKKKYLSVLLCATMVGAMVAGCGNGDSSEDTTKAAKNDNGETKQNGDVQLESDQADDAIANLIAATEGKVELTVWCSEMESYQTTVSSLVDQFKQEYSDVDFDIQIGAVSEANAKDTVLEDPEAAADVFVFADDQLQDLVAAGALQSVDATYTYNPAETNTEGTVAASSVDGTLYAYPLTASNGYFLFYNSNELSEEDVASWEALTTKADELGKKVGMQLGTDGAWYLYGFFAGAGETLTKNEDGSNSCDWNNETGVKVAESIMNITAHESFAGLTTSDALTALADGDIVAYVSGTWDVNSYEEAFGDGYAACKLPTFDVDGTATQMGSYAGYKLVGVNSYSEQKGWSMLLAEFLTSQASQEAIAEATGEGPANIEAAKTIDSPALAALGAQSEFADQQVVGDKYWDPASSLAASLTEGKVEDVQALLDEAVEGITQPVE